jgi:hypothetical protein
MPCRADMLGTGLGPMTDEDYRKMESQSSKSSNTIENNDIKIDKYKYQELEEDLCTVRDLLYKIVNDLQLPDNLEDILQNQFTKYKEHRKEDFDNIKKNIEDTYDTILNTINVGEKFYKKFYENESDFYEKYKIRYDRFEEFKIAKEKINNISFEEFWKDRYLFEKYKNKE